MDSPTTLSVSRYSPLATSTPRETSASNSDRRDEPYYFEPFGDDGLTFGDILDVINPLQHIPVVSTFYREWTGDEIAALPRIGGGALFGGVIGAITSLVNVIVDEITGRDIGAHVLAFASDLLGIGDSDPTEMYAGATVSPSGDGETVPLGVASGAGSSPGPVTTSLDILEWPYLVAAPVAGGAVHGLDGEVGALEKRMASVRQGQVTDYMVMAMSMYEKSDRSAEERVTPKIDILS